jgi:hypothetical protein
MPTSDLQSRPAKAEQAGVPDEYAKLIDLHKFYLDIGTRMTVWSLAIIGAIVTYVSQQALTERTIRLALIVPLILSCGNAVLFLGSIKFANDFMMTVDAAQARLGASWRPHVELIVGMSAIIGVLFFALAIAFTVLMASPAWLLRAFPRG